MLQFVVTLNSKELLVRGLRLWSTMILGGMLLLSACAMQVVEPARAGTTLPATAKGSTATEETEDTGWQQAGSGLEFRLLRINIGDRRGELAVLRLDPTAYRIRVAYDTARPGRVSEWAAAVKPVAVINGGYFDASNRATALVIFDGIARGATYEGFGGMVVVNSDGEFELRSLRQQPYDPAEPLQQAMQSSPMLIQPGGVLSDLDVDEDRSRRSVIARDRGGRILLIVSDWPTFTLRELATTLKESDLEIDAALNLDGGRSTGLYLRTDQKQFLMDSFDSVPLVLVVDESS